MNRLFGIVPLVYCLLLVACNKSETTTVTTSNKATVKAFYFTAQDSFPAIGASVFTIQNFYASDTGIIYNADSMTYLTPITCLVPRITFDATPSSATISYGDTTITLTGKDTIDFNKRPIILKIVSSDRTTTKYYYIDVRVHQVDPDLFAWQKICPQIFSTDGADSRAFYFNNAFYLLANNGFTNALYRSSDGQTWTAMTPPSGLPDNCRVREVLYANNTLYYTQDKILYTSTDAVNWNATSFADSTLQPIIMVMQYNDSVWAIAQNTTTEEYFLATLSNGMLQPLPVALPNQWPVSDFTALEFSGSSLRRRATIIGGYDASGTPLNSRWNIEFAPHIGYRFANFAINHPICSAILGASVVMYGKQMYMFGGIDAQAEYISNIPLYSYDEGLNWYPVDTTHNHIMDVYEPRSKTTALVQNSNIYLIAGQTRTNSLSDVLMGHLTSINW